MKIFAAVPLELLMDTRLTARQFRLMVALLSFCHRGQMTVHPKRQTLAERARMRESQVSIETTALVRLGWLKKEGQGGNGKAVRYTILTPETVHESCTVHESGTVHDSCTVCAPEECAGIDDKTVHESGTVHDSCTVSPAKQQTVHESCTPTVHDSCTHVITEDTTEDTKVLSPPLIPPQVRSKRNSVPVAPCPADVEQAVYEEWLSHRSAKGCKPLWSKRAATLHSNEAARAGISYQAALEYAMERNWQAFHAGGYLQFVGERRGGYATAAQKKLDEMQKQDAVIFGDSFIKSREDDARTIDVQATKRHQMLRLIR